MVIVEIIVTVRAKRDADPTTNDILLNMIFI